MDENFQTTQHDFEHGTSNNSSSLPVTTASTQEDSTATVDETRGKLYDTPPESYSEAVSPLTSRKNGKLRAESLGISPSAGRGLSGPYPGPKMASQQKLPSLDLAGLSSNAMTMPLPEMIREPLPCMPPLSIAQRLEGEALGFSKTRGHNVPALHLDRSYQYHPNESVAFPGRSHSPQSPDAANPYEDRADEIGPGHGIPGIGHLGQLLIPPGWVEDMDPINPNQVRQLYDAARKKAREALAAEITDLDGLGPQERAIKEEERNKKWDTELRLEKLLMKERLAVHSDYQIQTTNNASGQAIALGPGIPATLDPPVETSIPYQHNTLRPEMPALLPPNYGPMRPMHRAAFAQAQFGSTHVGYASPTALDPSLATESLEVVMARHSRIKDKLISELRENDHLLSMFLHKYGYQFSRGPISPGTRPPTFHQRNGSFQFGQVGNPGTLPRPLPYLSPTAPNFGSSSMVSPVVNNMTQSFPPGPGPSRFGRGDDMLANQPHNIAPSNIPGQHSNVQQIYTFNSATNEPLNTMTATKKKRAPRKKAETRKAETQKGEKPKPWYHDEMVKANIPTSILSAEAMQAGIEFGKRNITAKNVKLDNKSVNTTPKKRRGKEVNTPDQGITFSKESTMQLHEAYAKGTMHPGMRVLWEKAQIQEKLNGLPGQMLFNPPYNDQANTNNVNYVYSTRPHANLAPGPRGSHNLAGTVETFARSPEVRNQESESRWQPLVPNQTSQIEQPTGSTEVTPKKAPKVPNVAANNAEESSELSTVSSSEDDDDADDENDPTFGRRSTRNKGAASRRRGSTSIKRKGTALMADSKRPRAASGHQQIDGTIDLTSSPASNQKTCGTRGMKP
ncbi:hypothetical protein MMC11_005455 [Xylographa trunciseda]|nr:hypothetical protein [Xylographa trunciseda]